MKKFLSRAFPDPASYPANRLFCLDLLRGLDIFLLTVLGYVVRTGLFRVKAWDFSEATRTFWVHSLASFATPGAVPAGFGIWDFAQPLFIFVCGAAVPFAVYRYLDAQGRPTMGFWRHLAARVAMLWVLGWLINQVLSLDTKVFRPYSNTLQTIAVAYTGAMLAQLIRRRAARLALALAVIAAYGIVQATCGDYSRTGNISHIVDERVFCAIGFWAKDFAYILTTPVWMAMGVLGSLAAEILKAPGAPWRKAGTLAAWGAASLALGWTLQLWIPPIRYIYTVSFIFTTFGYAMLLLCALYAITDIWHLRRGTGLFLLFGQCSLAAWMLSTFFQGAVHAIALRLVPGVPVLLGTSDYQPFAVALAYAVSFIAVLSLWYRLRTAEKRLSQFTNPHPPNH
ncbi:MAG: hypothetical protein IKO72_06550 [Kiritimatiellae bacterium]|nr:hypothetical protein [Kiritimatiellia bacterium]